MKTGFDYKETEFNVVVDGNWESDVDGCHYVGFIVTQHTKKSV